MSVLFFTIASPAYERQVGILAQSVAFYQPGDKFVLVRLSHQSDTKNWTVNFKYLNEFVEVGDMNSRLASSISIEYANSIVEAATAVKAAAFSYFMDQGYGQVVYLDPDTVVMSPLEGLTRELSDADIVLTPHQLIAADLDWQIRENEVASLKYGIFNFGCLGVKDSASGRDFIEWWGRRLQRLGHDDPNLGTFTDQKWGNLIPIFFPEASICRDQGINVASWNLSERSITRTNEGQYWVTLNGTEQPDSPLQLFHFTKALSVGKFVTARHSTASVEVAELWRWYLSQFST